MNELQESSSVPTYASALTKNPPRREKTKHVDGVKFTITNIDVSSTMNLKLTSFDLTDLCLQAALGEENIRQLLFTKINKTCEIRMLEIQPYNRFTMTGMV